MRNGTACTCGHKHCFSLNQIAAPQDGEGCRLSHVGDRWLVEGNGLPRISGDSGGVSLQPCPGVKLAWSASSRRVTLGVSPAIGAFCGSAGSGLPLELAAAPCGVVGVQCSCAQAAEAGGTASGVGALLDLAENAAAAADVGVGRAGAVPGAVMPAVATSLAGGQSAAPSTADEGSPTAKAAADSACEASISTVVAAAAALPAAAPAAALGLDQICSRPECRGVLALNLGTGEAAMFESEWCHLHLGPGESQDGCFFACRAVWGACQHHSNAGFRRVRRCFFVTSSR